MRKTGYSLARECHFGSKRTAPCKAILRSRSCDRDSSLARKGSRRGRRARRTFGLVAECLSTREIAARLVVSDEAVKTHVSRVLRTLALRDRAQAVVVAFESGSSSARRSPRPVGG